MQIGNSPEKIIKKCDPEIKSVCYKCNEGWMHDLENKVKPTMGCLVQDVALTLDAQQQTDIAVWSTKVAMVFDSTVASIRPLYYSAEDRLQLRLSSAIPNRTTVWLGRFSLSSLLITGSTLRGDVDGVTGATHNCVTTIVVGHLAIQVFTIYPIPAYQKSPPAFSPKPGLWDGLLTQTWPIISKKNWPPPLTFTNDRGSLTIARLYDRWKMGRKTPV